MAEKPKQKSVLVICTGNSCRSQMAEGFLKSYDPNLRVFSAGTFPSFRVHPKAIQVMKEVGIDLSENRPKRVSLFLDSSFDYAITVCDMAKESCPAFYGEVKNHLHIGFADPVIASASEKENLESFRKIRDQINRKFKKLYKTKFK